MTRWVELRRHTDNDGDLLTEQGVADAVEIGRGLRGGYLLVASSGAQRATQTAACMLAGLGEAVAGGVVVEPGLRSEVEDRWRDAYSEAGEGTLGAFRSVDPDLVADEARTLAAGVQAVFERLPAGGRALAIGHSPTCEAAVLGLTGEEVEPLGKGQGVLLADDDGTFTVHPL